MAKNDIAHLSLSVCWLYSSLTLWIKDYFDHYLMIVETVEDSFGELYFVSVECE